MGKGKVGKKRGKGARLTGGKKREGLRIGKGLRVGKRGYGLKVRKMGKGWRWGKRGRVKGV